MAENLGSILTAMVTPFDADGNVDEEAAVALMHHLVEHGSDGLVICGTTGEASTLADEEHLGMIRLAVEEMTRRVHDRRGRRLQRHPPRDPSDRARHRDRARRAAAHSTRTTTGPAGAGSSRHYEEICRATDLPILLYNIPQRTGSDMSNDLLAELAQLDNIFGVKQANPANLAKVDGLQIYAGNDDLLADVLDMGEPGGILVGQPSVRRGDAPDGRRARAPPRDRRALQDVYADMPVAPLACATKAALNLLGILRGTPRLPYVELDDTELEVIRSLLERHGLLQASRA